ncbi:threonine-phosphate decarboxylase [Halonotius terrestris]|uniref:threonine-phosphate decarboxylase n=1 Tax=Halonotius terrestris TaxID=2487750 RepID=A0A8J8TE09_9EURY|nr:threonine-phosphate decarboxylase CobD [Halonotius terrestris]TQQ83694.1 threonine-phosphate decarboxylase [Halonotius terrestris]
MDPEAIDSLSRVAHGGEADPQLLDFSANTNPRTPSGVATVYEAALPASRQYPVDDYCEFRAAAADYIGVTGNEIIPAAGSLTGMRLLFSVVVDDGDSVVVPTPSFGEYDREIRLQGGTPEFVPHDEVMAVDPTAHDLVIVCNPNNPTGESYETAALRSLADRCAAADTVLCVDEAFLDFTDRPSMAGTPGVVVARSLTKIFGLPGLRAGFLVATGDLRERLDVARPAWTLSTPAAAVGAHCLKDTEFVEETCEQVAAERERMRDRLETRFDVAPSDAPFLLCETDQSVDEVVDAARDRGVVVRDATTFRGLDSHIRVAVKRPKQNDRLLAALDV